MSMQAFKPDQDQVIYYPLAGDSLAQKVLSGTAGAEVQLRICNPGEESVHIRAGGDDTVAAETADMTVLSGVTEVLTYSIPATGELWLAVLGTGPFEVTGGSGF